MASTMQDLSDGVFINVANLTLAHRDNYIEFLKAGLKQVTLMFLRTAPMSALFPDHITSKAEEEIHHHEYECNSSPSYKKPRCFHPHRQATRQHQDSDLKPSPPAWKQIRRHGQRSNRGKGLLLRPGSETEK